MLQPHALSLLGDKIHTVDSDTTSLMLVGPINLPVNLEGNIVVFQWYCWLPVKDQLDIAEYRSANVEFLIRRLSTLDLAETQQSSVLVYGDFAQDTHAMIRMHSICHTGDIFGSKRCDCGYQLNQSMKMIVENGSGALFYLANHEGRGIGLFSKAMAYLLQEQGLDTVEANLELGFQDDTRSYAEAISILQHLRKFPVRLITNNPKKLEALRSAGLNVLGRVPLWGDQSEYNAGYLKTKVERSGHFGDHEIRYPEQEAIFLQAH